MTEGKDVMVTREQLYKDIWEISVAGAAKKYHADYNDLLKICKEADIPVPPSGYWMKLKFGKSVEQIPLPEASMVEVSLLGSDKPKRIRKAVSEEHVKEDAEMDQTGLEIQTEDDVEKELDSDTEDDLDEDVEDDDSPYWGLSGNYNTYKREKLYQEVWAKPVVKVAEQYGVSDVAIHKICKKLNIPTPPLGYWARVYAGEKMKRPPLPKTKGPTQMTGAKTYDGVKKKISDPDRKPLEFLPEDEREKLLRAIQEIKMPAENAQLHKKIAAYRAIVKEWNKKDRKSVVAQRKKDYNYNPPFLAGMISNESLPRVYRILDALFRRVENLGGSVEDDLSLRIRNEQVHLEIVEGQDKVPHVITKEEAKDLLKYQDAKRHHSWSPEPQIRKYDYVFNGQLRISIRQARYFRDTDKAKVESRLSDILIELYEESEKLRLARIAREEEARRKAEEERRKEERSKRYNEEVDRTTALENAAIDYQTACRIRAYVKAVADSSAQDGLDEKTAAWVDWAIKKADWFDPTVARDDDFFGEREHEKSLEAKVLKKFGPYW